MIAKLALHLLAWAIRRLLSVSRTLWADLISRVEIADRAVAVGGRPLTAEERHTDVDLWLSTMEPWARMPMARKYLIQSAVLWLRMKHYWAELPF
jgi:hypothetical protein